MNQLSRGCDILVATPGRLIDFIKREIVSLTNCTNLVFDEADRMLDMGFEPQIQEIFQFSKIPKKEARQTIMFSATFPPKIQELARTFLKSDIKITIGKIGSVSDHIDQKVMLVPEPDKLSTLISLIETIKQENESAHVLIFIDRKSAVDSIEIKLFREGYRVVSIHGDRSQSERDEALGLFRSRKASIMVATDVAQRGLDIPNVTHVINYSIPNDIEDYVHRIGRTGRVGNTGIAITFFNDTNASIASDLAKILSDNKQEVPAFLASFAQSSSRSYFNKRYDRRDTKSHGRYFPQRTFQTSTRPVSEFMAPPRYTGNDDTWNNY
uniref:RNA helicase n=1 Tax=Henneguya salminicola TaxID=69463 RepID=A0A6G3MFA6_HENSL